MQQIPDWSFGDKYLRGAAPELIPFMDEYGPCTLEPDSEERYFEVLLTGIAAQQLPPEVSVKIMERLRRLTGEPILPEKLNSLPDTLLASCGLTELKVTYMKEFARLVLDKTIDFTAFSEMSDPQIIKMLKNVKGLGQWTIEMFLILSLCRPDVLPGDDFLLKKEVQQLFALPKVPKRGQLLKLLEKWSPWRSLAVWYLWQHSADSGRK